MSSASPRDSGSGRAGDGAVAAAAGGASAVAVLASACCVPVLAPLIVAVFGVAGAIWAASLKPYAPWALLAAGGLLAWGHQRVWSARRGGGTGSGVDGEAASCPPTRRRRWVSWVLWTATALWLLAAAVTLIQFFAPQVLS